MPGIDLGGAVVLGLVLVGLVQLAIALVNGPNDRRKTAGVSLLVAFIAVQLVAASDFAAEQVVLDRPLNSLNFASQLVIVLLAAGVASGLYTVAVKALRNVGQNYDKP